MKILFAAAILLITTAYNAYSQSLTGEDQFGNQNQFDERGNNNFNPHNNDTTRKSKTVPKGIYVWTVDRKLGNIIKADVDTMPHLYPQYTMGTGMYGEYNTLGSNYTARLSRIFADRNEDHPFIFTRYYDQVLKTPEQLHFTNTLSPITNLSYNSCGDKTNGEDKIEAKFAVNAGKRLGMGFDLDYDYARGYFQNQNISHFLATLYASYRGDRYQMHAIFSRRHQKATENGGITNDDYVTHPELYTESYSNNEIPVLLAHNWNRNDSYHFFFTHRYSVGFYREVPMTEEEIKLKEEAEKARKEAEMKRATANKKHNNEDAPEDRTKAKKTNMPTGRPEGAKIMGNEPAKQENTTAAITDTTRISVDSKEMADSIMATIVSDSTAKQHMKKEFVPVTSFIHTLDIDRYNRIYQAYDSPEGYYANTYFDKTRSKGYQGDSIYDQTKFQMIRNTIGIGLLEGFNKWAKAGLQVFATHEMRKIEMPQIDTDGMGFLERWTEHNISIGGKLLKTQGKTLHYNLAGETWIAGEDMGQLKLDFTTDLNFPLWGDTVTLAAKAYLYRLNPTFYERHYHAKHFWWDNELDKMHRMRVEGIFKYEKTKTQLRVALEEIQNYTYFGIKYDRTTENLTNMTAAVHQASEVMHVLTAQIDQKMALGPLHWDNRLTYQTTSDPAILPLPMINIFSNLYLKFLYSKVLTVELGATATYFTAYDAPDFLPQLNQFAVQENGNSKVELGEFPIIDVYANLHLKHARFFVMMHDVAYNSFNRKTFLVPHYSINHQILKIGVSWNFFN